MPVSEKSALATAGAICASTEVSLDECQILRLNVAHSKS